jgi:hypothetical protein
VRKFILDALDELRTVDEIGQRVMLRHIGDFFLGAAALGNIFMRNQPAAVGHRLVDDVDRAPVRRGADMTFDLAGGDDRQNGGDVVIDIASEETDVAAMLD